MIVNDYSEPSSDPLLIQLIRGPTLVYRVGVYSSKLFEELRVSESGEWGVEAMGGPLFLVMKSFSAVTVLLNGKIVEMMGVATKT